MARSSRSYRGRSLAVPAGRLQAGSQAAGMRTGNGNGGPVDETTAAAKREKKPSFAGMRRPGIGGYAPTPAELQKAKLKLQAARETAEGTRETHVKNGNPAPQNSSQMRPGFALKSEMPPPRAPPDLQNHKRVQPDTRFDAKDENGSFSGAPTAPPRRDGRRDGSRAANGRGSQAAGDRSSFGGAVNQNRPKPRDPPKPTPTQNQQTHANFYHPPFPPQNDPSTTWRWGSEVDKVPGSAGAGGLGGGGIGPGFGPLSIEGRAALKLYGRGGDASRSATAGRHHFATGAAMQRRRQRLRAHPLEHRTRLQTATAMNAGAGDMLQNAFNLEGQGGLSVGISPGVDASTSAVGGLSNPLLLRDPAFRTERHWQGETERADKVNAEENAARDHLAKAHTADEREKPWYAVLQAKQAVFKEVCVSCVLALEDLPRDCSKK